MKAVRPVILICVVLLYGSLVHAQTGGFILGQSRTSVDSLIRAKKYFVINRLTTDKEMFVQDVRWNRLDIQWHHLIFRNNVLDTIEILVRPIFEESLSEQYFQIQDTLRAEYGPPRSESLVFLPEDRPKPRVIKMQALHVCRADLFSFWLTRFSSDADLAISEEITDRLQVQVRMYRIRGHFPATNSSTNSIHQENQ